MKITSISNQGEGASIFDVQEIELSGSRTRMLSERIPALNFRLRTSDQSYSSDWHVAGDPTLLVVLDGAIRIVLRNGEHKDFATGNMFIAQDYLPKNTEFDDSLHGHRAEVIGDKAISVLHLKLGEQP